MCRIGVKSYLMAVVVLCWLMQNVDDRSSKLGHQRMIERVAVFREAFADDKDDRFVAACKVYIV